MWKAVAVVWCSAAFVIGLGLYYTHDMRCLWFLLIPALMSFKTEDKKEKSDPEDPCNSCGYAEGSPYCLEHCPYDAKSEKE